jgi:hypothetical protein
VCASVGASLVSLLLPNCLHSRVSLNLSKTNSLHCPTLTPQGTGEDEDDVEASSASLVQSEEGYAPVFFSPRPLKNLVLVDEMPSLMPLTGGGGGEGGAWAALTATLRVGVRWGRAGAGG